MVISMLKIRRPLGRLIFNMGIAIPGKTVFLIETAPCKSARHYRFNESVIFAESVSLNWVYALHLCLTVKLPNDKERVWRINWLIK